MRPKSGFKTSEFKVMVIASIGAVVTAVISLLVINNLVTPEEAQQYNAIAAAVIPLGVTVAVAWMVVRYGQGRAEVKSAFTWRDVAPPVEDEAGE